MFQQSFWYQETLCKPYIGHSCAISVQTEEPIPLKIPKKSENINKEEQYKNIIYEKKKNISHFICNETNLLLLRNICPLLSLCSYILYLARVGNI